MLVELFSMCIVQAQDNIAGRRRRRRGRAGVGEEVARHREGEARGRQEGQYTNIYDEYSIVFSYIFEALFSEKIKFNKYYKMIRTKWA